jgi:hypothetical protein
MVILLRIVRLLLIRVFYVVNLGTLPEIVRTIRSLLHADDKEADAFISLYYYKRQNNKLFIFATLSYSRFLLATPGLFFLFRVSRSPQPYEVSLNFFK